MDIELLLQAIPEAAKNSPESIDKLIEFDLTTWEGIKGFLKHQIKTNRLLQGGFLLGALGSLAYYGRYVVQYIGRFLRRQFLYSVTVEESDSKLKRAMDRWVEENHSDKLRQVRYSVDRETLDQATLIDSKKDPRKAKRALVKENLSDWFWTWYKGRYILVYKEREKLESALNLESVYMERYTISGLFAKKAIDSIMADAIEQHARELIEKLENNETFVYVNGSQGWEMVGENESMDLGSIVFDRKEELREDISDFINSKEWYKERSLDYKRGYLLYGPAGNGKTAMVLALARYFGLDAYVLNLKGVGDSGLRELINGLAKNSLLLIEDVDCMGVGSDREGTVEKSNGKKVDRTVEQNKGSNTPSLQSFLNCMGGALQKDGMITFMTTNHPEKLDKALIRTGRLDVKMKVGPPSENEVRTYLSKFYSVEMDNIPRVQPGNVSMSDVMEVCKRNKNVDAAVPEIETWGSLRNGGSTIVDEQEEELV